MINKLYNDVYHTCVFQSHVMIVFSLTNDGMLSHGYLKDVSLKDDFVKIEKKMVENTFVRGKETNVAKKKTTKAYVLDTFLLAWDKSIFKKKTLRSTLSNLSTKTAFSHGMDTINMELLEIMATASNLNDLVESLINGPLDFSIHFLNKNIIPYHILIAYLEEENSLRKEEGKKLICIQ